MEEFAKWMLAGFIVCMFFGVITLIIGIIGIKTLNEESGGKSSNSDEKVEYAGALKRLKENQEKNKPKKRKTTVIDTNKNDSQKY